MGVEESWGHTDTSDTVPPSPRMPTVLSTGTEMETTYENKNP